jgi:two-component system, LytTR family, sensor kinase
VQQSAFHSILKKYWLLPAICIPLGVLFMMYFQLTNEASFDTRIEKIQGYVAAIFTCHLIGLLAYTIDRWLDRKISWKNFFLTRFSAGLVLNFLMALTLAETEALFAHEAKQTDLIKIGILLFTLLVIYEIFYGWFYSYRQYVQKQIESLKLDRLQMELQFELLKGQISPHFLFNCLNTISSLLYKDTKLAEEFIRRMADTFQYVLKNQKKKTVPLQDELDFVKSYYYLLQVRFENNLRLEINLPKNLLGSPIPPLTLQMLMENSVKHNVITKEQPLLVYLSARDNTHILVTNSKTKTNHNTSGFQVGLDAIHKRYAFFTSEKIQISDSDKFIVQLPVLKQLQTIATK